MDAPHTMPAPETPNARPLLPAAVLRPNAALWLWLLPIGVLLLLNLQGYWLVEGNMNDSERTNAFVVGGGLLANLLIGATLYFVTRRRCLPTTSPLQWHAMMSVPVIIVQVAYLWLVLNRVSLLLPTSVTLWIYPEHRFLFNQFTFAMPPLFLGVMRLAGMHAASNTGRAISTNVALAIGAPVALFLFLNVFNTFGAHRWIGGTVIATVIVLLGLLMFFAIVRALLLVLRQVHRTGPTGERIAIVVFALVMPISGLLLNRTIPFPVDFQAWEVYALVVANTAILLLASWQHTGRPHLSFNLLCVTFPFSLYFFAVFLPYTPLSIFAIIALGLGFLVLTPTFLFTLHLHLLYQAGRNSRCDGRRRQLLITGLLCVMLLPAFFVGRGLADKSALHAALDYIYSPTITDEGSQYPGSRINLRRALANHRHYKNGIYYPILSDFYSWLVFDNLILPDEKLARLEETFFGFTGDTTNALSLRGRDNIWSLGRSVRDRTRMPRAVPPPRTVVERTLDIRTATTGDHGTVVTCALTLENNGDGGAAEFVKKIVLPDGIFVRGLRLAINGTLVPGRIFEKKTALWVYAMIRDTERRDPALLFYNSPSELELRVFPINRDTPAVVEIDFLIPGKTNLEAMRRAGTDLSATLAQANTSLRPHLSYDARGVYLAGGLEHASLPVATRERFLHVIVDRSEKSGYAAGLAEAVPVLQAAFPRVRRARVTLANYDHVDVVPALTPFNQLPPLDEAEFEYVLPRSGGLALDLVLAHALQRHQRKDLDAVESSGTLPPQPIFVLLSHKVKPRPRDLRLAGRWADTVAKLELHHVGADGKRISRLGGRAPNTPLLRVGHSVRPLVPNRSLRFAPADQSTALEYWDPSQSAWLTLSSATMHPPSSPWAQAAALHLQQHDYHRRSGNAPLNARALVQASRESGTLLASTSYIVVENEAQWRMLEKSEEQKLGQNEALDFRETPAPPALIIALGFGVWLGLRGFWRRLRPSV